MFLKDSTKFFLLIAAIALSIAGILELAAFTQDLPNMLKKIPIGRLPGDIILERQNFKVYIPLTTCFMLSNMIMMIRWLFLWLPTWWQ